MRTAGFSFTLVCLVVFAAPLAAQPAGPGASPPAMLYAPAPERVPGFSLTISPIHLALPVLELTGEVRLGDKLGVAGILGAGKVTATGSQTFSAAEVGGQLTYYLLGNFRSGMQLGVEVLALRLIGAGAGVTATGEGLEVGPMVGYKHVFDSGLTLFGQFGWGAVVGHAKATSGTTTATASAQDNIPILNLNAGWSF